MSQETQTTELNASTSGAETPMRAEDTFKAITQYYVDVAAQNANLSVNSQTWTSSSASGSAAYVFFYLQVGCYFKFSDGTGLTFDGKGMVVGLGATGSLGGQGVFNVDPKSLKGASGITFQAFALGAGAGGFQVTFFKDNTFIGHAEFYGAGVTLGTPGGGWGSFS
ncbi:MAG: hypothetical protein LUM44_24620 [Pyrinomonadaceae bacterium]|nr:hypothetical protein [Pyrinomonadaceae bacterium]